MAVNKNVLDPGQNPKINPPQKLPNTGGNVTPGYIPTPEPVQPQYQTQAQSTNEQIWGEGGTKKPGYDAQLEKEKVWQEQYDTINNGYTEQDLQQIMQGLGLNTTNQNSFSQSGQYIKDGGDGLKPGTGEKGWTLVEGTERPVAEGTSGADERHLSDNAYAYVQYCKEQYAKATTDEERAYWHAEAEKTRASYGYSAGLDGSMYITNGALGAGNNMSGGSAVLPGELGGGSLPGTRVLKTT